jgi:hypothetical protein
MSLIKLSTHTASWLLVPQVRSREEELMNLGSLHTATKAAADKRIAELEGRVSRLLEANRCRRVLSCVLSMVPSDGVCVGSREFGVPACCGCWLPGATRALHEVRLVCIAELKGRVSRLLAATRCGLNK